VKGRGVKELRRLGVDWVELAYGSVQQWAFVNMVMNFWFHQSGEFLDQMSDSYLVEKEEFCSAKLVYLLVSISVVPFVSNGNERYRLQRFQGMISSLRFMSVF
jgi:hypothetical protein